MIIAPIRSALRSILLDVPGVDPARMKWEGRSFDPVAGEPYHREYLDPVSSRVVTAGYRGSTEERLIYTVIVFWPNNGRVNDGADQADRIRGAFHADRAITAYAPGGEVMRGRVESAERGSLIEDDAHHAYPVTITCAVRRPTRMQVT